VLSCRSKVYLDEVQASKCYVENNAVMYNNNNNNNIIESTS